MFTLIYSSNPMEPVALARIKIENDPFKYKTYPDTPPISPKMSIMTSTGNILTTVVLPVVLPLFFF